MSKSDRDKEGDRGIGTQRDTEFNDYIGFSLKRGDEVRYQVMKVLPVNMEPKYERKAINKSSLQRNSLPHYKLKQELSEKWGF